MFPKTGNDFPDGTGPSELAAAIGEALRGELGQSHRAIKTMMGWTGASDRAVKNWLAGLRGPSACHLVRLAAKSDAVMAVILGRAQRGYLIPGAQMQRIGQEMARLAKLIGEFTEVPRIHH